MGATGGKIGFPRACGAKFFCRVFPEKRLEQKSLKGQTKAEEEGTPGPFLLSLRLPLKALLFEAFLMKNSRKPVEPRMHRGGTDPLLKYLLY